jgi:hypothetical protein
VYSKKETMKEKEVKKGERNASWLALRVEPEIQTTSRDWKGKGMNI